MRKLCRLFLLCLFALSVDCAFAGRCGSLDKAWPIHSPTCARAEHHQIVLHEPARKPVRDSERALLSALPPARGDRSVNACDIGTGYRDLHEPFQVPIGEFLLS